MVAACVKILCEDVFVFICTLHLYIFCSIVLLLLTMSILLIFNLETGERTACKIMTVTRPF